jgi:toxin YoeB
MPYKAEMLPLAEEHYDYWAKHKPSFCDKIDELLEDIEKHPFTGLGKPEPLKHKLAGKWSRQITLEHRLVYEVKGTTVLVHRCKDHYKVKLSQR